MNDRMGEFLLAHELPIAVYSYRLAGNQSFGSWSPFCEYSPEWVALKEGHDFGAEVRFIDLPAWHPAMSAIENRYSDDHLLMSTRLPEVAKDLGYDSMDSMWDALFEKDFAPDTDLEQVGDRLAEYFVALRGEEAGSVSDQQRESFMRQGISSALQSCDKGETVLVVCGGYHQEALRSAETNDAAKHLMLQKPGPDDRIGAYLVPFSFKRLDSFAGYAAGMPSPNYYQHVWEVGLEAACAALQIKSAERLRSKKQVVSTADLITTEQLCLGLANLRGRTIPLRSDILDGLTSALVKEALEVPRPWTGRGRLVPRTHPILVELISVFSGDRTGRLDPQVPQPPLVGDVHDALSRVGMDIAARKPFAPSVDVLSPQDESLRTLLWRLSVLQIPGVTLVSKAVFTRGATDPIEQWEINWDLEADACLIERAVYGASLDQAVRNRLLEQLAAIDSKAPALGTVAQCFETAVLAGLPDLAFGLEQSASLAIEQSILLSELGGACERLVNLLSQLTDAQKAPVQRLLAKCVERGLWLIEALSDTSGDSSDVGSIAALKNALWAVETRSDDMDVLAAASSAALVCDRTVRSPLMPAHVRGACLGWLVSTLATHSATDDFGSVRPVQSLEDWQPIINGMTRLTIGDFLGGLFALGREVATGSDFLPKALDELLRNLSDEEFLEGLPSLRNAFAYFPPRERNEWAKRILDLRQSLKGPDWLTAPMNDVDPASIAHAHATERRVFELATAFGLLEPE